MYTLFTALAAIRSTVSSSLLMVASSERIQHPDGTFSEGAVLLLATHAAPAARRVPIPASDGHPGRMRRLLRGADTGATCRSPRPLAVSVVQMRTRLVGIPR